MPWELVGDRWPSLEPASEHPALYLEQRSEGFFFLNAILFLVLNFL